MSAVLKQLDLDLTVPDRVCTVAVLLQVRSRVSELGRKNPFDESTAAQMAGNNSASDSASAERLVPGGPSGAETAMGMQLRNVGNLSRINLLEGESYEGN